MDLDGDGRVDLISGSWPGEIFFFKGTAPGEFAAPIMLKDKAGKYICIGGGIANNGDEILITGHGEFHKDKDGKDYVTYHGQRIEAKKGQSISITGTASAVHAVDWDGDGDLDLLVGDIRGHVYFVPNEGDKTSYAFGKEVALCDNAKPPSASAPISAKSDNSEVVVLAKRLIGSSTGEIAVPGGDAGPFAADWDGDGKIDLLVGAGDGSVWFYRNVGTKSQPALAKGVAIVPAGKTSYGSDAPKAPTRGTRAKICACDWNGDGRLDLLLGDFATQKPNLPEPTPQQKIEHEKLRKELNVIHIRYGEVVGKLHGSNRVKDEVERKNVMTDFEALMKRMQELNKLLPPEYENHGWIWFFPRSETRPVNKAN